MFFKLFISNFSLLIHKVQNYSHVLQALKDRNLWHLPLMTITY
jgi:hypothetical protein